MRHRDDPGGEWTDWGTAQAQEPRARVTAKRESEQELPAPSSTPRSMIEGLFRLRDAPERPIDRWLSLDAMEERTLQSRPDLRLSSKEDKGIAPRAWVPKDLLACPDLTEAQAVIRDFQLDRALGDETAPTPAQEKRSGGDPPPSRVPEMTGIGSELAVERFVQAVRKVQAEWPHLEPKERAEKLVQAASLELSRINAVGCAVVVKSLGDRLGRFVHQNPKYTPGQDPLWEIHLNDTELSAPTLTDRKAAELADTVYHEARHAEQWHRIAQLEAGRGRSLGYLADVLQLPEPVAKQAHAYPLQGESREATEAALWYEALAGEKKESHDAVLRELERAAKADREAEEYYKERQHRHDATWQDRDHARMNWLAARHAHVEATARYRALVDEIDAWRAGAKAKHAFLRGRHGR